MNCIYLSLLISQGEKLHALLLEHGTMDEVECKIEQVHEDEDEQKLEGGYHCYATLTKLGWTKSLDT